METRPQEQGGSHLAPWGAGQGLWATSSYCHRKWDPATRCSKATEEARLVERKVCFILDAGNLGRGTPVQKPTPPNWQSGARAFIDGGRGLHAGPAQAALAGFLSLSIGGLTSVILIVLGTVGRFVPIPLRPVLELWQLMSWLQSGHRVVNFSTWCGFQYLQHSSQDTAQNMISSPWGGTKGPWLCLMTKLLLFGLLWLFSFVSTFSYFSD